VPTISIFFGIMIEMFWNEHAPPHFHAKYGEHQATFDIKKLELMEGFLPRRAKNLVLDWAELHQGELLSNWDLCRNNQHPNKIEPLE
jgi:Domain of unknown function (DUF4160)